MTSLLHRPDLTTPFGLRRAKVAQKSCSAFLIKYNRLNEKSRSKTLLILFCLKFHRPGLTPAFGLRRAKVAQKSCSAFLIKYDRLNEKSRSETLLILFCLNTPSVGLDEKKAADFVICCLLVCNKGSLKKQNRRVLFLERYVLCLQKQNRRVLI